MDWLQRNWLGATGLLVFCLELAMLTILRQGFGHSLSAMIFFLSSISVGCLGLYLSINRSSKNEIITRASGGGYEKKQIFSWDKTIPYVICFATISIFVYFFLSQRIATPINVQESDIIPQTQILVQRFLNHKFPYQTISDWGYDLFPTYQPMQWLPYSIAEIIGVDYRKLSLVILLIVMVATCVVVLRRQILQGHNRLFIFLLFLPLLVIGIYEPTIYTRTLENLIVTYYLLVCLALFTRSSLLIAIAISCCLLSRYSLVLWVPLFLFILSVSHQKKQVRSIAFYSGMLLLIVYVLPFFAQDTSIFIQGYQYHTKAALGEWQGQSWQQPGEKPIQLFRGIGFAGFFYDHLAGTTAQKLKSYQLIHLLASVTVVLFLASLSYKKRKDVNIRLFALASLKIYLSVFYHFIQIPYDYLFLPLLYCSVPIVWVLFNKRIGTSGDI